MIATAIVAASAPAMASSPCGANINPIACENSKPGADPSQWDINGSGDPTIQGFATDMSVNVGSTIDFKIDTDASAYSITIYRTGWYQGLGARKIATVTPSVSLPQHQDECVSDSTTEIYDCGTWAVSASWSVPSTAVSGVYIAVLKRADTGGASQITFVVRDDSSHSDVLFKTSDATWQAYNTYGGSDFYQGAANGRAYKISYNRPFATRGDNEGRDFYFSAEYPLVRFLEKNGYDVSYFTDVDTDRHGSELTNHKVFLSVGHDEYWSTGERANVENAIDAGVNAQFLSGNEVYWHTRFGASVDGNDDPYRTIISYKETWSNAKIDPSTEWSGTWRDPRFASAADGGSDPENALTGTIYMSNFTDLPISVTADEGKLRMWRNTGLSAMAPGTSTALAPHTIGYESDEDLDNGFRQSGLIHLSTTTGDVPQYLQDFGSVVEPGTTTHNMTLYRAESGALVWGAGTVQWTWGLDQEHDGAGAPADARMQQAQVNMLADMGAQPTTLDPALTAATASTDHTAPTVTVTAPAPGSTVANGSTVTVSGTASDSGGGVVAGVEVSVDNGETWHLASGTTSWSYSFVQHGYGTVSALVRAVDDSANYAATPTSASYGVSGPYTVFGSTAPKTADAQDSSAAELGMRFTAQASGFITGVRFYKSAANTGAHTGSLWDAAGTRLATVEFSDESASGWQQASFTSAVPVQAGQSYVVSYSETAGHYSGDPWYWAYRGTDAGPLTVAGGFGSDSAGVYSTDVGTFPTSTYQNTNYYVDALFTDIDTSPLVATAQWPLPDSSSVPLDTTVNATFSRAVDQQSISFTVVDALGQSVAGSTAYDADTRIVTFTPDDPLAGFVAYTATLSASATSGGALTAGGSWSFTTVKPPAKDGVCPCSLYDDGTVPAIVQEADPSAVTLGVRVVPNKDGEITGVSFYKAPGNTGSHVGTLWSSDGTVLAQGTFANESSSGWQTLTFGTAVPVTAGTTYVATYRTQVGNYSATPGAFSDTLRRGPLEADFEAGTYSYADAFPTTRTTTSYLVDVVFDQPPAPFSVVTQTPGADAIAVDRGSAISLTASAPLAAGYGFQVTSGGTPIDGTTSASADGATITFTPSGPLPNAAKIDVTVNGLADATGHTLPGQVWSFTTADTELGAGTATATLFGDETPAVPAASDDPAPVSLGVSFTVSTPGTVTALRFFKGQGNGGTHTGALWSSDGTELASVTYSGESASGWQTAQLETPVALTPGQTYVVSYYAPQGHYAYTSGYFANPKTSGPITAGTDTNGRYLYGTGGGFPIYSWGSSNYFVDVVFSYADSGGSTGGTGGTGGDTGGGDTGGTTGGGSTGGSGDTGGSGSTPASSTATTVPAGSVSFFAADATPQHATWADDAPVQVGVRFSTSAAGVIDGIRYYRSADDTGTRTITLWAADGTGLAAATAAGETASGWQYIPFTAPVAVTAGGEYIASYYSTGANYAVDPGGLSFPITSGALSTISAAYVYGTGFPDHTASHNYWVDVAFSPNP